MLNLILLGLICLASLASGQRRRVRYTVCVDIADCLECNSNAPRIGVERAAGDKFRPACDLMGPFPRGSTRCCTFGTRQVVNAVRLVNNNADDMAFVGLEVKADNRVRPIFTYEAFERVPGGQAGDDNAYLWLRRNVVNEQTFRFGFGPFSPVRGTREYEVEVNVDECQFCESGAPDMQVWFVDNRGNVDNQVACQLQGTFPRGAMRRCRFTDNRDIGGVVLGSANTDGMGFYNVKVRDVSRAPQTVELLFRYDRTSFNGWGGNFLGTAMWVDGQVVPKQTLIWY